MSIHLSSKREMTKDILPFGYPGTTTVVFAQEYNQPDGTVLMNNPDPPGPDYVIDSTGNWDRPINKDEANALTTSARRDTILREWPIYKQLEAITENIAGRPEKMNKLLRDIEQIKQELPKVE